MSHDAKGLREANRNKAMKMANQSSAGVVDASGWTEKKMHMDTEKPTYPKMPKRGNFKRGGSVPGECAPSHAGKRPRKMGGGMSGDPRAGAAAMLDAANKEGNVPTSRMSFQAPGSSKFSRAAGLKTGGKAEHSDEKEDRKLIDKMVKPSARTGKLSGGKLSQYIHGAANDVYSGDVTDEGDVGGTNRLFNRIEGIKLAARKLADKVKDPAAPGKKSGGWIAKATKNKGALHRALHIPEGTKIPEKKLEKAEHSSNPKMRKRAQLAETLKSFHKDGGKVEHPAGCKCEMCHGGRVGRKSGGRTKGKTSVNIVIQTGAHGQQPPQGGPPMPPKGPAGVPVPVSPPPGLGGPSAPPPMMGGAPPMGGMPPGGAPPMPMPRKAGGRVPRQLHRAGAGSGLGRLDKIEIEKVH